MPRVIHFEIPADDPARAVKFYGDVFGWQFTKWDGPMDYWLAATGDGGAPGIDGAVMRRPQPGAGTVNTLDVPSLDEYVTKVQERGGRLVMPKQAIPGVGWLAYCQDPDGNTFGLMESDQSAA